MVDEAYTENLKRIEEIQRKREGFRRVFRDMALVQALGDVVDKLGERLKKIDIEKAKVYGEKRPMDGDIVLKRWNEAEEAIARKLREIEAFFDALAAEPADTEEARAAKAERVSYSRTGFGVSSGRLRPGSKDLLEDPVYLSLHTISYLGGFDGSTPEKRAVIDMIRKEFGYKDDGVEPKFFKTAEEIAAMDAENLRRRRIGERLHREEIAQRIKNDLRKENES